MTINKLVLSLSTLMVATSSMAEMEAIDDFDLSEISGKGGVYLSGEFAINKDGGLLNQMTTQGLIQQNQI